MKNIRNLHLKIFLGITITSFCIFAVMTLLTHGGCMGWLTIGGNYFWQFSDYFRQIVYASDLKNIYSNTADAPFPPFAYCFFHLLYFINPIQFDEISLVCWAQAEGENNLLIFFFLFGLVCMALYFILESCFEGRFSKKSIRLFFFSVMIAPFMLGGALERGNIVVFAMVCLLLAIYWKDSDSKIKRELALILIAVAAGLKIYPAIFGLLYVKEKRWKETVRLVLYGLTVFFAPFVFAGGLTGFLAYLNDLRAFQGIYGIRWTSIGNYGYALINALGIDTAVVSSGCMKVVEIVYFLLLLTVFFITKEKWKAVFYLSAVITTFVPNSWRYVAVYMVIALTAYFAEINGNSKRNLIYSILFSICFSIPWYGYFMNLDADFCIFTAIYVCIAVSFGEEIGSMCRRIMKRDRILRN